MFFDLVSTSLNFCSFYQIVLPLTCSMFFLLMLFPLVLPLLQSARVQFVKYICHTNRERIADFDKGIIRGDITVEYDQFFISFSMYVI